MFFVTEVFLDFLDLSEDFLLANLVFFETNRELSSSEFESLGSGDNVEDLGLFFVTGVFLDLSRDILLADLVFLVTNRKLSSSVFESLVSKSFLYFFLPSQVPGALGKRVGIIDSLNGLYR